MSKKIIVIHPFLFALFPVLFLFSQNIGQTSIGSIYLPAAINTFFAASSFFLLNAFLKNANRSGLVVSLFLLAFFSYGHILQITDNTGLGAEEEPARLLITMGIIFIIGAYFFIKTKIL